MKNTFHHKANFFGEDIITDINLDHIDVNVQFIGLALGEPFNRYSPSLQVLNGVCWPVHDAGLPLPPFFDGDNAKLVKLHSLSDNFILFRGNSHYIKWLNSNINGWLDIESKISSCDPYDRMDYCISLLDDLLSQSNLFDCIVYDAESYQSGYDFAIQDLAQMIIKLKLSVQLEDTWSNSYKLFRNDDYDGMIAMLLSNKCEPIDLYYLLEGICTMAYKLYLSDKKHDIFLYGSQYIDKISTVHSIIPEQEDGIKICQGLQYLAMYYEREKNYKMAIFVCEQSIKLHLHDNTKGGFIKRVEKLKRLL